jgi:NAD-dependent dihydropyrimidine dehydrogenase PreA subunit
MKFADNVTQMVKRSPNANILFKGEEIMAFIPTVDASKCEGCEECVDVCPTEVFEMENEKSVPVNAEECLGCESCIEVCETDAITIEET